MSRRNNVRGPTSALTEFLRESGITPTTIARRVRTREVEQPVAGPSIETQADNGEGDEEPVQEEEKEYASDNLDDTDTERPPQKKRKLTKSQEAKQKAQAKKAAAKKKKGGDDDDYSDDEDAYTALSKMWKDDTKPSVGSFCRCAKCEKQFTVTKYTMAANPPPGYLCHPCYKASGADPFKKPAAPKKRRTAADKRTVTNFEERHVASLASLCVQIISKHIDDVEALGDIGSVNLDKIAKAIAKDRSLTSQNATLLYDIENTNLTLYDATNLIPAGLITLSSLNPNLVNLRLDYCGRMNNEVLDHWSKAFPNLRRLELLGPFLVHASAWQRFFQSHQDLTGFLITQSPRFDLDCMQSLVENCTGLKELRLREIDQLSEDFLTHIETLGDNLIFLDISNPGESEALSTESLSDLMNHVCENLTHLDLSGNVLLSDGFLYQGLKPHARKLHSLILSGLPDLSDAGVAEFFDTWNAAADENDEAPNPPLTVLDMSRCQSLSGLALAAALKHSAAGLEELSINGWRATPQEVLMEIGQKAKKLSKLDIGWCREADDWVVKEIMDNCKSMEEVKVWGCQRISERCPRRRGVALQGVESHTYH